MHEMVNILILNFFFFFKKKKKGFFLVSICIFTDDKRDSNN